MCVNQLYVIFFHITYGNIALSRAKEKHWVGGVPLSKLFSRVSKSIFFQCIIQLAVPLPK